MPLVANQERVQASGGGSHGGGSSANQGSTSANQVALGVFLGEISPQARPSGVSPANNQEPASGGGSSGAASSSAVRRVYVPRGSAPSGGRRTFAQPLPVASSLPRIRDREARQIEKEQRKAQYTGPIKKWCGPCKQYINTDCFGLKNWAAHLEGKKHKNNVRKDRYWSAKCEFCNLYNIKRP